MDGRGDLIGLSDWVYQRTRRRLDGLTDDELRWEPVDELIHHGAEVALLRDLFAHLDPGLRARWSAGGR
jgi:hypothetical protein